MSKAKGATSKPAAQKTTDENVQSQPVAAAGANSESAGAAASEAREKGPDNNKRLGYLEARLEGMTAMLASRGVTLEQGQDAFDVIGDVLVAADAGGGEATPGELAAIRRAEVAEAAAADLSAHIDQLAEFLLAREGFVAQDEGAIQAAMRVIGELDGRLAELEGASAGASDGDGRAGQGEAEPPPPLPRRSSLGMLEAHEVPMFADLPEGCDLTLLFSDGDELLAIPPRPVAREALLRNGRRAVINVPVDFPPEIDRARVRTAWLATNSADTPAAVRCEIPSGGLRVGGGLPSRFPAGHLIF